MKRFQMKGIGLLLLVMLAAAALIGCDMIDTDENTELNDGNDDQSDQEEPASPFLTPYCGVSCNDVSLTGDPSGLPEGYTEKDMVPLVVMSVMASMQEEISSIEQMITGEYGDPRSISAMMRLKVANEVVELGDTTFSVDHLDLELAAGIDSFSDLLSNISAESPLDTDLLMDIALSGRVGISTFTSMASTAKNFETEPLDFAESLFLDLNIEDFEMSENGDDGGLPEISGTLTTELKFSAARNVILDMEMNPYRIPAMIEVEMRTLERPVKEVMETITAQMESEGGFEALCNNKSDFFAFCNDLWGTEDETGFITLAVEMDTSDGRKQTELKDYDIITLVSLMMQNM